MKSSIDTFSISHPYLLLVNLATIACYGFTNLPTKTCTRQDIKCISVHHAMHTRKKKRNVLSSVVRLILDRSIHYYWVPFIVQFACPIRLPLQWPWSTNKIIMCICIDIYSNGRVSCGRFPTWHNLYVYITKIRPDYLDRDSFYGRSYPLCWCRCWLVYVHWLHSKPLDMVWTL